MIMKSILRVINEAMMGAAKERVREELLRRSDRQLDDIGVSRELLLQGVKAWPWRVNATDGANATLVQDLQAVTVESLSEREISRAIAELNRCSDVELRDLGLTRRDIPHAVRYGRPGHPNDLPRAA